MRSYEEVAGRVLERRDAWLEKKRKRQRLIIRTSLGAGLAAAALTGLWIWQDSPEGMENNKNILLAARGSEGNPDAVLTEGAGPSVPDGNQILPSATGGNSISENSDGAASPLPESSSLQAISYDSLKFPETRICPEVIARYGSAAASMAEGDILPFEESMLSNCCAVLEGTVTDMYLKTYSYDTYDDKFGTKEVYHNQSDSVVYELTVDRVWYGDQSLAGTAVLVEDETYLTDSFFSLMIGGRYVIPLSDAGETKRIWKEYAGGDITRDSRYTSLYPHHPQITVTENGNYIVTDDWESLCSGTGQDILLDPPEIESVEYHPQNVVGDNNLITTEWRTILISAQEARYYYDRLKLIESEEFFIRLNRLLDNLP